MGRGKDQIAGLEVFLSGPGFLGFPLVCPNGTSFMTARLLIDTNILIYALDPADPVKRGTSADVLRQAIASHTLALSPQNLNECYKVLTQRRRLVPMDAARSYLTHLMPWCIAPLDATNDRKGVGGSGRSGP